MKYHAPPPTFKFHYCYQLFCDLYKAKNVQKCTQLSKSKQVSQVLYLLCTPHSKWPILIYFYILSSYDFTSYSSNDFLSKEIVFPPAFSTKKPTAAASYKALNLNLWFFDPTQQNTPWFFMKICATSTIRPPVYLKVKPLFIHPSTTFKYSSCSLAHLKFPGLNILVFSFITKWSCDIIQSLQISVSSCTLFWQALYRIAVVLGPYITRTALTCAPNFSPINFFSLVGQMEYMLPIEKFVSMIELPSKGSQVTQYPSPSPSISRCGLSQLAKPLTLQFFLRCSSIIQSHLTS